MPLEIVQINDDAGARAYHALDSATVPVDHPGLVAEPVDDVLGSLANPMESYRVAFYLGRDGSDVRAIGFLGLPLADNRHMCDVNLTVALDARRRGLGTQVAAFLLEEGRRNGRRLARGFVGSPLDATSPGDELATKLGATAALGSIRRELRLDVLDRGRLEAQVKELLAGPAAGYDLFSWTDTCPAHLVDGAAAILPFVMSDSPRGELEMEDEVWDAARYHEYESMLLSRNRHSLATAAVERATGRLVAYTDLNVARSDHRIVSQYGTVVLADHRGQRLGIAVKTANLVALLEQFPAAESVQTFNATENAHMIAVNEALGFRAVERETIWQLAI
jgi:GNAT superfamily N-acetyltransferase